MKNRTEIEWLNEARANGETWVDQAVENIKLQPDYAARQSYYLNLSSVVERAFLWEDTPKSTQGYEYWKQIYNRLLSAEKQNK